MPGGYKNIKPQDGIKSQFKKGKSGNDKGRPPKLPQLDVLLAKVLGAETGGITEAERIILAMKKEARKGNVRAAELILDRSFGKVAQQMNIGGVEIEATVFVLPNGRKVVI